MINEYFKIVYVSLRRRKLRSWLTIIGIVIGITAVIALVSISSGMNYAFNKVFENIGSDKIMISPGGGVFASPSLVTAKLTEKDLKTIQRVNGVEHAIGIIGERTYVTYGDEKKSMLVFGIPTDSKTRTIAETMDIFSIEKGRQLKSGDKYKAAIGYTVANEMFDKEMKLKDIIEIKGKKFEIVGIQKKSGSPLHDRLIRIPKETAKEIFNKEDYNTIFVKVMNGYDTDKVAEEIKKELRKERNVEEGKEDFSVRTSEQIISGVSSILGWVQIVFISIATISLVVGGIGIMNTMYTAVSERTKEIGIMKAVGARNVDVLMIFVIESGLLGLIGGIGGTVLGVAFGKVIEILAKNMNLEILRVFITPELIIFSLLFSFVLGVIFGFLPALRAARLKPIEAMRHE